MSKDRNTIAKRLRENEKKRKAEEKRQRRNARTECAHGVAGADAALSGWALRYFPAGVG